MGDQNRVSIDGLRLRWLVIDKPLEQTVHVLDDVFDAKSSQKPYKNESGELHPIHQSSISTQPLQQLAVTLPDLINHILYDECPEDHPDYVDGEGIAYDEPTCNVTASNGEYITIEDFVSAVHPWLISLRDRYFEDAPVPGDYFHPDVELWVQPLTLLDGITLHHIGPDGDSREGTILDVWAGTAEIAYKMQNGWPKGPKRRQLSDEEILALVEKARNEPGGMPAWTG